MFPQKNCLKSKCLVQKWVCVLRRYKFNLFMLLHYHSTPLTPCNCKKLLYFFCFFSIIGFKCCILGRIHFRQSAGSGLWILSNSPMCKLSNIHVYCIFAKLNSNFNLNLNWVEFSNTFVLSDHSPTRPPGLVVGFNVGLVLVILCRISRVRVSECRKNINYFP